MIVITGPLRSGTSPLARMAHQMGIVMGESMGMPRPGSDELEFEDYALSHRLARHVSCVDMLGDTRKFFVDYLTKRAEHYLLLRNLYGKKLVRGWGMKSPYLLPFYDEIRAVLRDRMEPLRVVLCEREPIDTYRSLERSAPARSSIDAIHRVQDTLYESLGKWRDQADVVVTLGETCANPGGVAKQIARLAGFDLEDEDRPVAVNGIRRRKR